MPPIGTYKLVVRLLLSLGFKQDEESLTVHHQKHLYEWVRDEDKHHFFLGKHKTTNVAAADEDGTLSYIYTMDEWESWQSRNIPAVGSVKKARITAPAQASLEAGSVRQAQASLEAGSVRQAQASLEAGSVRQAQASLEAGNMPEPDSPLDNGAGAAGMPDVQAISVVWDASSIGSAELPVAQAVLVEAGLGVAQPIVPAVAIAIVIEDDVIVITDD